jgi:GAF domain-containing protein
MKEKTSKINRCIEELKNTQNMLVEKNIWLTLFLEASRLTASNLNPESILEDLLSLILKVSHLKVRVIYLIDINTTQNCWEYFNCDQYECPAYHKTINCWRLMHTHCHGSELECLSHSDSITCWLKDKTHSHGIRMKDYEEKLSACTSCFFFSNVVLLPRLSSDIEGIDIMQSPPENCIKALLIGKSAASRKTPNHGADSMKFSYEIAIPLGFRDQIVGVLYLAAEEPMQYEAETLEFLSGLSSVISSAILGNVLYERFEL